MKSSNKNCSPKSGLCRKEATPESSKWLVKDSLAQRGCSFAKQTSLGTERAIANDPAQSEEPPLGILGAHSDTYTNKWNIFALVLQVCTVHILHSARFFSH